MHVKLKNFSFKLPYKAKMKLKVRNIILIPTSIKIIYFLFFFFFAHFAYCALILTLSPQIIKLSRTFKLSVLYRFDSTIPELEIDTDESEDKISNPGHDHLVRRSKSDKVGGVVVCR